MKANIFKNIVDTFQRQQQSQVPAFGRWKKTVHRADGTVEEVGFGNVVTALGLDEIAALAIGNAGSTAFYIAVGTVSDQFSLGSTILQMGEVLRQTPPTKTSSKEVLYMVTTIGGASDGLTGVALTSAAMGNHVDSGQGIAFNLSNSVNTTLQASDILTLEAQIQIGSHNL